MARIITVIIYLSLSTGCLFTFSVTSKLGAYSYLQLSEYKTVPRAVASGFFGNPTRSRYRGLCPIANSYRLINSDTVRVFCEDRLTNLALKRGVELSRLDGVSGAGRVIGTSI
jgi:hypothetical protein